MEIGIIVAAFILAFSFGVFFIQPLTKQMRVSNKLKSLEILVTNEVHASTKEKLIDTVRREAVELNKD